MAKLRLSHAILLGDSLKAREPRLFLNSEGTCGCAIGGAILAAGGSGEELAREIMGQWNILDTPSMATRWPWLENAMVQRISQMYSSGESIEAIAAYADSIDPTPRCEPPVQEPAQVEVRQESTVSHG